MQLAHVRNNIAECVISLFLEDIVIGPQLIKLSLQCVSLQLNQLDNFILRRRVSPQGILLFSLLSVHSFYLFDKRFLCSLRVL